MSIALLKIIIYSLIVAFILAMAWPFWATRKKPGGWLGLIGVVGGLSCLLLIPRVPWNGFFALPFLALLYPSFVRFKKFIENRHPQSPSPH